MTRNPSSPKAEELAVLGAELVQADLDDEASLRSALEGKWGVYAVQNTWEAGVEGEEEQRREVPAHVVPRQCVLLGGPARLERKHD